MAETTELSSTGRNEGQSGDLPTIERAEIESRFASQARELASCPQFEAIASGTASRADYDRLIASFIRAHLRSPQIVSFLFALAPPDKAESVGHNLLEEMGRGDEDEPDHPSLLRRLALAADLDLEPIEELAALDLRRMVVEPLLYASLKEAGLAALTQVCAFEWMLSRTAGAIGRALLAHRGLADKDVEWFTLHSEVDIRHAEEGLDNLLAYISYYQFSPEDARTIIDMSLRENIFIKRYFGELSLPSVSPSAKP